MIAFDDWQKKPTVYIVTHNADILYSGNDYAAAIKSWEPYPDGSCVISATQDIALEIGSE